MNPHTSPFNWQAQGSQLAAELGKKKTGLPSTLAPRVFHNFTQAGDAKPKEAK